MIPFTLRAPARSRLRLLCLGAHCDDLEIGCGGTLLTLLRSPGEVEVHWVVLSSTGPRREEACRSASEFLQGAAARTVEIKEFRDGFFPYLGYAIKEFFEDLKQRFDPDVIFTHYRDDRHQDHRLVSDLTWNTFRNHLILEYEIPKYDGDLGSPNVFMPLHEADCRRKAALITQVFETQRSRPWFTEETFLSLLRLRGIEASSPTGYAEAFYCRKAALEVQLNTHLGA